MLDQLFRKVVVSASRHAYPPEAEDLISTRELSVCGTKRDLIRLTDTGKNPWYQYNSSTFNDQLNEKLWDERAHYGFEGWKR